MSEAHLFVYGSLINMRQWQRKNLFPQAQPVRVRDYRLGWYMPVAQAACTVLAVVPQVGGCVWGLLVAIDSAHLDFSDQRELPFGYRRAALAPSQVDFYHPAQACQLDQLWVYCTDQPTEPTPACPVIQSYVDVVLEGCLAVGDEFACDYVRTLDGWTHWVDDRAAPRYGTHMPCDTGKVDDCLQANLSGVLMTQRRQLASGA